MQSTTTAACSETTRRVCPEMYATRLFLLCAMTYIIGLFGRMSYAAVTVELILDEGFTKAQAGLIGTALFAVYGVCQFFSGFLGDRISPKKMHVSTGVFGSAVLNIGMGLTADYRMMLCWCRQTAYSSR